MKPHGLPSGGSPRGGAGPPGRPAAGGGGAVLHARALELTEGNREEAAKLLGIGERTLYRKIQEWKKEERSAKRDG